MPIVAVVALGAYAFLRPDDATSTTTDQGNEQVVEASLGSLAETVTAEGTVAAAETDELSFTSAGTVFSVYVSAVDTITAG
jgi:multidrug efflux pump subunit AcrA (membrane-fusion protein)